MVEQKIQKHEISYMHRYLAEFFVTYNPAFLLQQRFSPGTVSMTSQEKWSTSVNSIVQYPIFDYVLCSYCIFIKFVKWKLIRAAYEPHHKNYSQWLMFQALFVFTVYSCKSWSSTVPFKFQVLEHCSVIFLGLKKYNLWES